MKPKNIMLLGFVNKAVDYLDKHMDEEPNARLAELKNIDLASIKEELNDNLDSSLGTMQSTMSTLLKAGNEAFDKFIEDNHGKNSISDQLNRIFDVDLDSDKQKGQDELAKLLSFYNLEDDFDIDERDIETPVIEDRITDISINDEYLDTIRKNVTRDDIQDIIPIEHNDVDIEKMDSIFSEIVENENKETQVPSKMEEKIKETIKEKVEETIENNTKETVKEAVEEKTNETVEESTNDSKAKETQSYVSSLIDDLRKQLEKEEKDKKEKEDKNSEVYKRISNIYPYLPQGFLRSVYELKESLASEYPADINIIVLHRVKFTDVDDLRKFVEIGINHGYTINADEKKMIVDIFKQFVNADGKILTNIYDIANQGYLLKGEYEGYNVIVEED